MSTISKNQKPASAPGKTNTRKHKVDNSRALVVRSELQKTEKKIKKDIKKQVVAVKASDGSMVNVVKVEPCVGHFAEAIVLPFETPPGACLPTSQATYPSVKEKGYAQGNMQIGANQIGWLAFRLGSANDVGYVSATQSSSVGSSTTALNAFTNILTFPLTNFSRQQTDFTVNGVLSRPLAGGIRLKYTGSLMNQNGIAYSHVDIEHSSVMTSTFNQLVTLQETKKVVVTGNTKHWTCQCIDNGPATINEWDFNPIDAPQSSAYMVILLAGQAGDQYTWEAVCHTEIAGNKLPNETASHTDPVNAPKIQQVQREAFVNGPPQISESKGIFDRMIEAVGEYGPKLAKRLGGGVLGSLPTIVQGLMSLTPTTGGNPLLANQGFSQPMMLMSDGYRRHRLTMGNYRGSNMNRPPHEVFLEELSTAAVKAGVSPQDVLSAILSIKAPLAEKVDRAGWNEKVRAYEHDTYLAEALAAQKAAFGSFKSVSKDSLNGTEPSKRARNSGSYDS